MKKAEFVIKIIVSALFFILGLVVICIPMSGEFSYSYDHTFEETYGGDAYTGIQNACADISRNVMRLGRIFEKAANWFFASLGIILVLISIYLLATAVGAYSKTNIAAKKKESIWQSEEKAIEMLGNYKKMLDNGMITEDEYNYQKNRLFGFIPL